MPRVGVEKGERGKTRPRPVLGGAEHPPLGLWRRKAESASLGTLRPVSGVSESLSPPGGGTAPSDLLFLPSWGRSWGSYHQPLAPQKVEAEGMEGHVGACAEVEGPRGPSSFPVLPSGRGTPAAASLPPPLQPPSPTLVAAPLFNPHCFLLLQKVPAAPEAAVGPATRPQAPEPLANGTPLSQTLAHEKLESKGSGRRPLSSINSPSWRALL